MKPILPIAFPLMLLLGATVQAGDGCCDHCGCQCACQKVCRLVCENKVEVKYTYGCKCEDFCVPGPSQRCKNDCDCGHCDACKACKTYSKYLWTPGCGDVRTRHVLEKYEHHCTKPTYKWVVEYLCPTCNGHVGK